MDRRQFLAASAILFGNVVLDNNVFATDNSNQKPFYVAKIFAEPLDLRKIVIGDIEQERKLDRKRNVEGVLLLDGKYATTHDEQTIATENFGHFGVFADLRDLPADKEWKSATRVDYKKGVIGKSGHEITIPEDFTGYFVTDGLNVHLFKVPPMIPKGSGVSDYQRNLEETADGIYLERFKDVPDRVRAFKAVLDEKGRVVYDRESGSLRPKVSGQQIYEGQIAPDKATKNMLYNLFLSNGLSNFYRVREIPFPVEILRN